MTCTDALSNFIREPTHLFHSEHVRLATRGPSTPPAHSQANGPSPLRMTRSAEHSDGTRRGNSRPHPQAATIVRRRHRQGIIYSCTSEDLDDSAAAIVGCPAYGARRSIVCTGAPGTFAGNATGAEFHCQAVTRRPQSAPRSALANQFKVSQRIFVHGEGGRSN